MVRHHGGHLRQSEARLEYGGQMEAILKLSGLGEMIRLAVSYFHVSVDMICWTGEYS